MDETQAWHGRERQRQYDRQLPVWAREYWFRYSDIQEHHYLHVSASDRRLLAYTADDDKGRRDIQTPIKPGRYLAKFFTNILTAKQIAFFAQWQTTGVRESEYSDERAYPLYFAHTPEEIVRIYMHGPSSCMDGRNFPDSDNHPCQVYGAGDLAIAYLSQGNSSKVRARALVWPAKKIVGRVYPSSANYSLDGFSSFEESELCASALRDRLMAEGYRSDYENEGTGFNGARLLQTEACHSSRYLMPYLDHAYRVNEHDGYFVMYQDGRYAADNTNGRFDYDSDEDDEPEYDWTCERCDEGQYDHNDQNTVYTDFRGGRARDAQSWCQHCADHDSFYCEATEENYSDDMGRCEVNGQYVLQAWADENCYISDHSNEYFDPENDPSVEMADGETWAESERDADGFVCEISGKSYAAEQCHADYPTIGHDVEIEYLELWIIAHDSRQLEMGTVS